MFQNNRVVKVLAFSTLLFVSCRPDDETFQGQIGFSYNLPPGVDYPNIPADNPITQAKIKLGERLFFDNLLSVDSTVSCASCHLSELAFSDGLNVSVGVEGRRTERNSPTLNYVAWHPYYFHDGGNPTLESQAIGPIENVNEMNMNLALLVQRLRSSITYQQAFTEVYGEWPNAVNITGALATYERSLAPFSSRYDDALRGNSSLSAAELRGKVLFESDALKCSTCHVPPLFTDFSFRNNGLVPFDGRDSGRARITLIESDKLKFKVPTLRNVAKTHPYFHNGSVSELSEVIDLYASGGYHTINQDSSVTGFLLTPAEKSDLLSFLHSLSDQ